jgi:hypothetical protein
MGSMFTILTGGQKMNIKSLLLGSAAALVAATGARAADAVTVAEPEPVEYVRVCDVYGAGFFYIPGSETCLKIGGYARYDIGIGNDAAAESAYGAWGVRTIDKKDAFDDAIDNGVIDSTHDTQSTWYKRARVQLRLDARSETELGTLRAYLAYNMQATTANVSELLTTDGQFQADSSGEGLSTVNYDSKIEHAYLELGGFRAGKTDSLFSTFTGYAGGVTNDDIIPYGPYDALQLAYTYNAGNGFTAAIALEDPAAGDDQFYGNAVYTLDSYAPNVVGGIGYTGGWGGVSVVAGYDAVWEKAAVKGRVDVKASDALSFFVMAGWADKDDIVDPRTGLQVDNRQSPNWYGGWGGKWAIWGGGTWQVNPKAAINVQLSYDDFEDFAAAANVAYELVPGFKVTPEIDYFDNFGNTCPQGNFGSLCDTATNGVRSSASVGGFLRLQRTF